MNLNIDYEPIFFVLAWFVGVAIIVGSGVVFLRNSLDGVEDRIELLKQIIRRIYDAIRK